jgi:HD-GYP domain-containing protein (c-di-GMP phosphodiesterase class II)
MQSTASHTKAPGKSHPVVTEDQYFSVSPLMLLADNAALFSVYLRQGNNFVLYTHAGEMFTHRHKQRLAENGVTEVWLKESQRHAYTAHVEQHLGNVLADDSLPAEARAGALYGIASDALQDVFAQHGAGALPADTARRARQLVEHIISFLKVPNGITALGRFNAHDYHSWTHSLNTTFYTLGILQSYGLPDESMAHIGLGAMLHDIGKAEIPSSILLKPGPLTASERQCINTHPLMGVTRLAQTELPQTTLNCILLHHEKLDGSGYPSGIGGTAIPLAVRAVTVADIYDALASERPYAAARPPFAVLQLMRGEMADELDMDVFKNFVLMLSNAGLTKT